VHKRKLDARSFNTFQLQRCGLILISVIERRLAVGCSDWLELKLIWYTWIAGSLNLLEPLERQVVYRDRKRDQRAQTIRLWTAREQTRQLATENHGYSVNIASTVSRVSRNGNDGNPAASWAIKGR
jgi:hypothetical protein